MRPLLSRHPAVAAGVFLATFVSGRARAEQKDSQRLAEATQHGLRYQIHFALLAAGPLLFNDVPDRRLEHTDALQYGARATFLFGSELRDLHRGGLGFAGGMLAQSPSRAAGLLTPYAVYEIGHPLILQASAGYAVGVGTGGYAEKYSGIFLGSALRYSFRSLEHASPIGVSLGIGASLVLATSDIRHSSVFVGPQIEIIYHSDSK